MLLSHSHRDESKTHQGKRTRVRKLTMHWHQGERWYRHTYSPWGAILSCACVCLCVCFFFYMCVSCPYFEKANQRSLDDKKKMCDPRHTVCLWYTQVFIFKVHWFIAWLLKYFHSWTTNYWIYKLKSSNEHSKITDFNSQRSLHFYNRSSLSCQFPLV